MTPITDKLNTELQQPSGDMLIFSTLDKSNIRANC